MSSESAFVSSLTYFQTCFPEAANSKVGWLEKSGRIWRATQNTVEFLDNKTGHSLHSWSYEPSKSATIWDVCECETTRGRIYYLIIIHLASSNLVCLLEFNRLIKVIELPVKISCACFFNHSASVTHSPLASFHGIGVLGCHGGSAITMDLQFDVGMKKSLNIYKTTAPSSIREIMPRDSPKVARQQLLRDGIHVFFNLNRHSVQKSGRFIYRAPDGTEFGSFTASSVKVTAVTYLTQTTSLAVGYSFGCFQIFNLQSLAVMFSSNINQANPLAPISHIVLQEPENDPRKYLFLWIGHNGAGDMDGSPPCGSKMTMYQLAFEMESNSKAGVLIGCASKLEFPLSSDPYIPSKKLSIGNQLISCSTAPGLFSRDPAATGVDLTVLIFVWASQSDEGSKYHVGVFDLNRWYYAQMPRNIRWERAAVSMVTKEQAPKVCSFLAFHSLDNAVEEAAEPLIGAIVTGVSRFYSPPPTCEAHQWPSSLSFDLSCVYSTTTQKCKFLGLQESVLRKFCVLGSDALDDPSELFSRCVAVHLLAPTLHDSLTGSTEPVDNEVQRRLLLNLALERDMFSVLYSCARSWTTGVLTPEGCTLAALLDWVWVKLVQLKQDKDQLCQSLFDGVRIGDCLMQQLVSTHYSLAYLTHLFHMLLEITSTEQGHADLVSKCHGCAVHKNMLEVILWCIENKVLPQSIDETTHCLHYPLEKLKQTYMRLRHPKEAMASDHRLLIDVLHDEMGCGEFMADNLDGTFYPPDSLEQLINIYATQNTSIQHCIMIYYLTDLTAVAMSDDLPNQLVASYTKKFSVPSELANFTQGLWHLDHCSVKEAHKKLMHCMGTETIDDLVFKLYTHIVDSYMDNGGAHNLAREFAVLYGSCDPSGDSREKAILHINLLVAAGRLSDAVIVTRNSRQSEHDVEMFNCLLEKCQQAKKLNMLASQSLTAEEDAALCSYLEDNPSLACQELLVMFHIQRSRYVEAQRVNRQLNERQRTVHDPQVWERSDRRNAIVNGLAGRLPGCIKSLAQTDPAIIQSQYPPRSTQSRPQPMSTVVAREANTQMLSQAHYITMVMEKIGEAKSSSSNEQVEKPATLLPRTLTPTPRRTTPLIPATPKSVMAMASISEPFVLSPLVSWQKSASRTRSTVAFRSHLQSAQKTPASKPPHSGKNKAQMIDLTISSSLVTTPLMERVNKLKQSECVELPDSLKTPTMKKSPVINTSLQLPSSLQLPQSILKQRQETSAMGAPNQQGVADSTGLSQQPSTRKIRFAAPLSPEFSLSPELLPSSIVKSKTTVADSPVIISDDDNEEYYSPVEDADKETTDSLAARRFANNFTASGEEMIDLTTLDSSNPPSGVQTPESTQQSTYPHIKLLDFLSPGVSPKDLALSIKKRSSMITPQDSGDANGSVVEPTSVDLPDASVILRYGVTARSPVVTARSPMGSDEPTASTVRQISPPQNPDELKRPALLPLDKRVTTPITTSASSLMSARVSIRKFDSPGSALTTSINEGMVSVRKKLTLQSTFNTSSTKNTTVTGDTSSQYRFSPPVEVLSQEKTNAKGASKGSHHPVSFPFSPPLTRSQRRKTVDQEKMDTSKVELFSKTMMSEVDVEPAMSEADVQPEVDMAEVDEAKETGKKKQKVSTSVLTTSTKRTYHTRSSGTIKTRSTPRVGANYDTVLLHPMPTPGSTPAKDNVTTRKPRQKAKTLNKPPLNLRRSSRLLDSTHTDSRRH